MKWFLVIRVTILRPSDDIMTFLWLCWRGTLLIVYLNLEYINLDWRHILKRSTKSSQNSKAQKVPIDWSFIIQSLYGISKKINFPGWFECLSFQLELFTFQFQNLNRFRFLVFFIFKIEESAMARLNIIRTNWLIIRLISPNDQIKCHFTTYTGAQSRWKFLMYQKDFDEFEITYQGFTDSRTKGIVYQWLVELKVGVPWVDSGPPTFSSTHSSVWCPSVLWIRSFRQHHRMSNHRFESFLINLVTNENETSHKLRQKWNLFWNNMVLW